MIQLQGKQSNTRQTDTLLLALPQSISAPEKDIQKESSMMPLTELM